MKWLAVAALAAFFMASTAVVAQDDPSPVEDAPPTPSEAAGANAEPSPDPTLQNETQAPISGSEGALLDYDPAAAFQGEVDPGVMENASSLIAAGGPVIIILGVLSVLAIALALVKGGQFIFTGVGRTGFVRDVVRTIRRGDTDAALSQLDTTRAPVARVMAAALRGKLDPEMEDDLVREETTRVAQANLDGMERGLALLRLIAETAPLLGLLGTVLGMIEAFQQMQLAGDRIEPGILAGGIWEALLTTAAGLTVALPAAAFHTWFSRTVEVETQHMEDASTQVFTLPLYPEDRRKAKAEPAPD